MHAHIDFAVRDDFEWYLETAYCDRLMRQSYDADGLLLALYVLTTLFGFGLLIYRVAHNTRAYLTKGKEYAIKILLVSLSRILVNWSIGLLIILPNALYHGLFAPCLHAYSFEATAVHQVGIALGIAPLAEDAGQTMEVMSTGGGSKLRMNATTCHTTDLLPNEPGATLAYTNWSEGCANDRQYWTCDNRQFSVMLTPAPHHTSVCLTEDDLEGARSHSPASPTARPSAPCQARASYER